MDSDPIEINKAFFISLIALCCIEAGGGFLLSHASFPLLIGLGILRLLEIILFLLIFFLWGNGLSALGLGKSQIIPGIKQGIIWSVGFGILVILGAGILSLFGINPFRLIQSKLPRHIPELIIYLLVGGLIGPIAEELFFRGILYGFFRTWGIFLALFLSTLFFVLLHSQAGITQIIGGILFAVAYELEGKLMVPILIHVLGNMAIFMISLLS